MQAKGKGLDGERARTDYSGPACEDVSILSTVVDPSGGAGTTKGDTLGSDASVPPYRLPVALSVLPSFCVLAAATFVAAARTYERDLLNVKLCVGPEAMSTATRP